jgi:hypothetical protein
MTGCKRSLSLWLAAAGALFGLSGSLFAASTNANVSATRNLSATTAAPGASVTVTLTVNVGAIGANPFRGFYVADNVPAGLVVSGQSVTLNGAPTAVLQETGAANEVYTNSTPYRWVFETPTAWSENRPMAASRAAVVQYTVQIPGSAANGTVYTFQNASWVGIIAAAVPPENHFGYLDLPDATITVSAPGSLQFSAATYSVNENGGTAMIAATRTGGSNGAVSVSYATSNGTATAGSDYTAASGTLSWANGDTANKAFTVTIANDAVYEGNETVNLTLSGPTGGATLGAQNTAVLTIFDNDLPAVTVAATDATAAEGSGDTGTFTFTRTGSTAAALTVNYTTGGTAASGTDYTALSGSVTITAGSATATVTLTPLDDAIYEGAETASVTISASANYTVGAPASATVTINDNDVAVTRADIDKKIRDMKAGTATAADVQALIDRYRQGQ